MNRFCTPANGERPIRRGLQLVTAAAAIALVAAVGQPAMRAGAATATAPTAASAHGWLRFAHFAIGTGTVKVQIDGKVIDPAASFETVTPYESVAAGHHTLRVSGVSTPVLSRTVTVAAGGAVTASALRGPHGLEIEWFADNLVAAPAGEAKVRVINIEPASPRVMARLQPDGATDTSAQTSLSSASKTVTTAPAAYGQASSYINVPSGHYAVDLIGSAGQSLVSGKHWPVAAGTVASLVVVHAASGPTLEVVSDAAGAAQTPTGAMATGFGGAAALVSPPALGSPPAHDEAAVAVAVLLFGALLGAGVFWVATHRSKRTLVMVAALAVVATAVGIAVPFTRGAAPVDAKVVVARGATVAPVVAPPPTRSSPVVDLASAPTSGSSHSVSPSGVRIPSLGIAQPLVKLGLAADGTAAVPTTATQVGWFTGGPVPGEPGPAVILGHVDSKAGPGVFFRLHELQPGAEIDVTVGRSVRVFAVQRVQLVAKNQFPTAAVFGPVPDRALRLVTCGGPFDRSIGHYEDNVIVFATEVHSTSS